LFFFSCVPLSISTAYTVLVIRWITSMFLLMQMLMPCNWKAGTDWHTFHQTTWFKILEDSNFQFPVHWQPSLMWQVVWEHCECNLYLCYSSLLWKESLCTKSNELGLFHLMENEPNQRLASTLCNTIH
jgi:hypothetical protein